MPTNLDFSEARLPTALSFGSEFGPEFMTDVVVLLEGAEQRNSRWSQARTRGDLRYSVKTLAYLQQLLAFYHARRGMAQAWRFKWHIDFQGTGQFVAIGDGATSTYQLLKIYDSGSQSDQYVMKVTKPVGVGYPIGNVYDSVALFQDDVWMTSGYSIDYTTGIITLDDPLGDGVTLTATYEFDWPCRFASDTFLESLIAILTLLPPPVDPVPPPSYWILYDQNGVPWYYWFDTRGSIAVLPIPPPDPLQILDGWVAVSWIGVSDETTATWYLFPDLDGTLMADSLPPPLGSGHNFNVPLPFPLAGLTATGEDGETVYTLAADSRGEPYIYHTVVEDVTTTFDALGQTDSIPIVGVRL